MMTFFSISISISLHYPHACSIYSNPGGSAPLQSLTQVSWLWIIWTFITWPTVYLPHTLHPPWNSLHHNEAPWLALALLFPAASPVSGGDPLLSLSTSALTGYPDLDPRVFVHQFPYLEPWPTCGKKDLDLWVKYPLMTGNLRVLMGNPWVFYNNFYGPGYSLLFLNPLCYQNLFTKITLVLWAVSRCQWQSHPITTTTTMAPPAQRRRHGWRRRWRQRWWWRWWWRGPALYASPLPRYVFLFN